MNWTTEILRSGVSLDEASDDSGTHGIPGTWYRVCWGGETIRTMRNRGDALMLFQRTVRYAAGALDLTRL